MTRTDPGAATGNQTYPPLGVCGHCDHLETLHRLNSGRRGVCNVATDARCFCPGYTPKEA